MDHSLLNVVNHLLRSFFNSHALFLLINVCLCFLFDHFLLNFAIIFFHLPSYLFLFLRILPQFSCDGFCFLDQIAEPIDSFLVQLIAFRLPIDVANGFLLLWPINRPFDFEFGWSQRQLCDVQILLSGVRFDRRHV